MIFFFNETATTEIYTLSLHDALPISGSRSSGRVAGCQVWRRYDVRCSTNAEYRERISSSAVVAVAEPVCSGKQQASYLRSEEHTSELQSRQYLVCRLLLEKKKELDTT